MAVDLHSGQLTISSQDDAVVDGGLLQDQNLSQNYDNNDTDEDFIAELTRQMAHFMFQDDNTLNFSPIPSSHNFETSWDIIGLPQSTLWSPSQGRPEGPSQEPSPPATPATGCNCWETSSYDTVQMFDKIILDDYERGHSKYHGYGFQTLDNANVELRSNQPPFIDQQIRAIQWSRLKQEHVLKQNPIIAYRERQAQKPKQSEPKEQIQQFPKKGKANNGKNGRRNRAPASVMSHNQQAGSGMRALFLGGSGSRGGSCGTGVFLPRGTTAEPSESRKKPGCSTVLIPARVVQALQLHFDQMAATSRPKAGGFPPLHDVLVCNRDGMYSLQKRQSRQSAANIHNEMILPQEWTY